MYVRERERERERGREREREREGETNQPTKRSFQEKSHTALWEGLRKKDPFICGKAEYREGSGEERRDMSSAILRRTSSKQGLQNLLRVTAQRSVEDAEEIERERRRRAREAFRSTSSQIGQGEPSQDTGPSPDDGLYDGDFKPNGQSAVEEDEGFSDWTQKLEKRRQRRMEEQGQAEEEDVQNCRGSATPAQLATTPPPSRLPSQQQQREEEVAEWERKESENKRRMREREEAAEREERVRGQREREEEAQRLREENERRTIKKRHEPLRNDMEEKPKEKKKEEKVSYTSKVFLHQEVRQVNSNGDAAGEEVSSLIKTRRAPRSLSQAHDGQEEEAEVFLETEQKLEKIRRSHQEKETQELEQMRQRQAESELELEELKKRREERRRVRQEEERQREEDEHQRQVKEEEEKKRMKEEIERRRMEAAERRMKTLSVSSTEGEEFFSPLSPRSPTFKNEGEERVTAEHTCSITERTESLNRSLKKSNSIKKTQPPVLITKMDDRLEQYSHAIETTSKEPRVSKHVLMDIPSPPEPVASKKSLFEAGEAWNQNSVKGTPSKDTEGLKVGVADLITNWVKGNPDGTSKNTLSKPADVKAGDVLNKKNLWETLGDSSADRSGPGGKGTPSGKRYKFVVTGHGKYEKVPVNDDDEYTNGKPTGLCHGES